MYNNKLLLRSLINYSKILPIKSFCVYKNEISLSVGLDFLKFILVFLKFNTFTQYRVLGSITGVDYSYNKFRFELNYDLLSVRYNNRVKIKICTNEIRGVDSCEKLFYSANWYECEIWDMFGVFFIHHSSLRRILTDYGFVGNPLRKDFPLSGFVEIRYNENQKRILSEPLEFSQEYRTLNYSNPWD